MTASSIPDGISFADLQAFAKDAPDDSAIVPTKGPYNGLNEQQLKDLVDTYLENIHESCPHPMFAKAIIYRLINNMLEWHSNAGMHQAENDENENAMYWFRDAGKFQSMLCTLTTIAIGPGDFLME